MVKISGEGPQSGGLQHSTSARRMELGEVEFLPFEGAENIAQFVGFAASVKSHDSTLRATREIRNRAIGAGRRHIARAAMGNLSISLNQRA